MADRLSEADKPWLILKTLEQRARRRFGQHFLHRTDLVARMVRGARIGSGDRVVEIGPGLGILTAELLRAGADLTAVELDRDLAEFIRETYPSVRLVEADAAKVNWAELCPGSGWKVVANLPYNVGTGILLDLLDFRAHFTSVTVMLQREVVLRLVAEPGNKAYGAITVCAKARADMRFLLPVPPGAFHPPPKVESAVVLAELYDEPKCGPAGLEAFDRTVRAAFSQRRKTLLNALGPAFGRERAAAGLEAAGIDPGKRAEQLSLSDYAGLAAALHPQAG
jgi:16S rRNA (adenine1518-N6/adenine1519-N6)-dimethyltransferase